MFCDYQSEFNSPTDGKDGVRKFVTALSQYTRAFFIRYNHVSILEVSISSVQFSIEK